MKKEILFFLLILILAGIYWQWWLPGPRVANDFPVVASEWTKNFVGLPRVWFEFGGEGLGTYSVYTLWSWPFLFISGIITHLGISFNLLERILTLIPLLCIALIGIWKLGKSVNLSFEVRLIVSLFYLTNTYVLLVIDGGQLPVGLAYAIFPLTFLLIENSIFANFRKKILAALSVWILGWFDFRFLYILFVLLLLRFLYEFLFLEIGKWKVWIFGWLKSAFITTILVLGLNAYWIIPLLKNPLTSKTIGSLTQTTFVSLINLGHPVLMVSPHWFKNVFGNISPLRIEFILLPLLAFLAPILRPKDKVVGFWVLVALVSIFLTKGFSEPFDQAYSWLFKNVLGFSLFRDSTKFFFLISISYAVLIGISVDEILKRARHFKGVKITLLFLLTLYFLIIIRPVWMGKMTGTFSRQPFEKEYAHLNKILEDDKQFSRVFWIPSVAPLGSLHPQHPSVEAARLVQRRPFVIGTKGTYEIFNFLREATFMGEIFDVAGIGYVVYPYLDLRRDNLHPDNIKYYYTFSDQLSNLPWLSKVPTSPIPLYKVKEHQDRFFVTPNVWWVIGSDSIYNEATKSAKLKLSKNALIFAEEYLGVSARVEELPGVKIVLNNKTDLDLAASFIDSSSLIFPAKDLDFEPDYSGWWKREAVDLIRWRSFLQSKYGIDNQDFDLGGGWAVGEGNRQLTIDPPARFAARRAGRVGSGQLKSGNILLARVLESTRSGSLSFSQDGKLIGQINTKKPGNNIRWFEVGKLSTDEELNISSQGDINVVNALAVLDKNEWLSYQDKARRLQGRIVTFDEKNTRNSNNAIVSYQKINSTKYIVNVENLTEASFLVFSQNFDKLWKLENQQALPVYSLLNGFLINHDGEYILEFEVQKYVYPGLVISFTTLVLIIYLLLFHKHKQSSI